MSELKAVETEKVEVTQEQQDQEAAASLKAGYDRAAGVKAEAAPEVKAEPEPAATKPEVKPEVKQEPDEWAGVQPVVRKQLEAITGNLGVLTKLSNEVKTAVGRFQSEVAAAKAVAKTVKDAPTQEQIEAASHSLEEWNKLKEDFQGFSTGIDQRIAERLAAERAEILKKIPTPSVDVEGIKQEIARSNEDAVRLARAFGRVDAKFPEWETDIRTPEFKTWENKQAPEIRALADSDDANDSIKMLEMFYDHRKKEAAREKQRERLATGVLPKQANSGGPSVLPDEAGLAIGYNRMAKRA